MGLQEEWGGEEKRDRYELFIIEGAEELLEPVELNN